MHLRLFIIVIFYAFKIIYNKCQRVIFLSTVQVKLSTTRSNINLCWATSGVLAVSTGDNSVRLWNIDTGDNYVLRLKENLGFRTSESIMCLAFCAPKSKILYIFIPRETKTVATDELQFNLFRNNLYKSKKKLTMFVHHFQDVS